MNKIINFPDPIPSPKTKTKTTIPPETQNQYKPNPTSKPMNHLVIDTETTGLSPAKNKTLTVGLLLINPHKPKLKIIDSHHIFIKHKDYNANPFALKINKINLEEHHKIGIPAKSACKEIASFLCQNSCEASPIIGHNINFDKNFLGALFQETKLPYPFHHESIDTIHMWKDLQKKELIPPQPNSKLGHLASHFEIDYTKAHDALADCHVTAQVYHKMLLLKQLHQTQQ